MSVSFSQGSQSAMDSFIRKSKCQSLSHCLVFVLPWTVAHQAPLSTQFSRQEYWSGLPFPSPGDFNSGIQLLHYRQILYHMNQGSPIRSDQKRLKNVWMAIVGDITHTQWVWLRDMNDTPGERLALPKLPVRSHWETPHLRVELLVCR